MGHSLSASGIKPLPSKVEAISNFKLPETVRELRRFLGMMNFYRRFLPHAAEVQLKLHSCYKGNKKNDKSKIIWTDDSILAFESCKSLLVEATNLVHPLVTTELALMVDASDYALGAVLQQNSSKGWEPLGFFSKRLNPAQVKYSVYDRELLAAYSAVKHFRSSLEGRNFVIYTDQKPLIFAFNQAPEKASPRQLRQLDFIGQFTTDLRHISGKDNVVADTLSRVSSISLPEAIDFCAISEAQQSDPDFKTVSDSNVLKMEYCSIPGTLRKIICDTSTGISRPFIPVNFRRHVFEQFHGFSHPGTRATSKLISERFIWPSIKRDCST